MTEIISSILAGIMGGWFGWLLCANFKKRKQFHLIIQNLKTMSAQLDAIKADLEAAQALQVKIAADVQRLHDAITALGDAPTQAQLDEVKALSGELVSSLQTTDDATPE